MSNARNLANLLGTKTKVKDVDVDGTELILDADGDTSITADTDDQIDIKIGGSDVGVIGSNSSRLHIVNGDTGLRIAGDIDQVFPCGTSGADRDNAIDLGSSGVRFKDLYLSGGLYVGGTGSANFLDDYEEGTFTPTTSSSGYTISDSSGSYTKVGRLVNLHVRMVFSAVNSSSNSTVNCNNIPFTKVAGNHQIGVGRETSTNGAIFVAQMTQDSNVLNMNSMDGIGNGSQEAFQAHKHYIFHIAFET